MIVVLFGPPGAGKGTQADRLVAECGFAKVATGDALRKHVRDGLPIGREAEAIMAQGRLVPDSVLLEILKEELAEAAKVSETILLDGYPRNTAQAQRLLELGEGFPLGGVIHLDVPREVIVQRLCGRRVCSNCGAIYHVEWNPPQENTVCDRCGGTVAQRPDDLPDKVETRLQVYEEETAPVLDFYRERGLCWGVDGQGDSAEVQSRIAAVLGEMRGRCG